MVKPNFTVDIDKLVLYILIAAGLFLFNKGINQPHEVVDRESITKVEIIELIKEFKDTQPVEVKTIRVPIYKNKIIKRTDTLYLEKETSEENVIETKFKDSTANSIVKSTIYSWLPLLGRDVKIIGREKVITTETKETIVKNNLFYTGGVSMTIKKELKNAELGVIFTNKDKWLAGAGIGYDFIIPTEKVIDGLYIGGKIGLSF